MRALSAGGAIITALQHSLQREREGEREACTISSWLQNKNWQRVLKGKDQCYRGNGSLLYIENLFVGNTSFKVLNKRETGHSNRTASKSSQSQTVSALGSI